VNAFCVYLEVVTAEGRPAAPREVGRLIGTDLEAYGMPFIRYDLGDLGSATGGRCACGRGLPLLASVEGRSLDLLYGTQGRSASSAWLVYAMGKLGIPAQLQFLQDEDLAVEVRVVPEGAFDARHEDAIRCELSMLLGEDVPVRFRQVQQILRAPSGKYVYAQSRAAPDAWSPSAQARG
jgi:phenylacetate-CoA ligase